MKINLRLLYLYLFSFVGLFIVVIGSIQLVNLGIKTFVFKEADKYEIGPVAKIEGQVPESKEEQEARQSREMTRNRQRELANAIAMISVGAPLYLYHWRIIQKEGSWSDQNPYSHGFPRESRWFFLGTSIILEITQGHENPKPDRGCFE